MTDRPSCTPCPSPNFRIPNAPRKITCFVVHATETAGLASPKAWLCNPQTADPTLRVSAHWLVDRDGTIYELVDPANIAWHAGESQWRGQSNVNAFSVGAELVNLNDGKDPYPDAQLAALAALAHWARANCGLALADFVGHADVVAGKTPEKKAARLKLHSDPGPAFPWDRFRQMIA